MSSSASQWLLPAPVGPIDLVAERTASGLEIPVPAGELLRERVLVETIAWPHEVDALMIWQSGVPTRVFMRERPPGFARRVRMTAAHELGHFVLPWHVGYGPEACTDDGEPRKQGDYITKQEAEAREFAGKLLMPHSHLVATAEGRNLEDLFTGLDRYETSAWATCMRLAQVLRPGFMLVSAVRDPLNEDRFFSQGTRRSITVSQAKEFSVRSGTFTIGGKPITWFQFSKEESFLGSRAEDPRRPSQILRQLLSEVYPGESSHELDARFRSYQGVLGSAMSHGHFDTPDAVLRQARQAVDTKIPCAVREHPDWEVYLQKTVANRAQRLGLT